MECIYNNHQGIKRFTVILTFVFLSVFTRSWGQAILTFDFAGAAGNEASLSSSTNNVNISSSTITRTGLTASANGDRFGSTNFSTSGTIDLTKYIEFTVTPLAGNQVSVTSVAFLYQRSATGPLTFSLRSNFDSYASNLGGVLAGADVTTTQTFNFVFPSLTPACNTPITFRLYAYASEATTGTGGPEDGGNTTNKDIVVNGSVASCGSSHTVTFNNNGGSGLMTAQTSSSAANLTSNTFTQSGCTFNGWNTAVNGSGTSYADGASYSFSADITLYAQWNCAVPHTVTFNSNGGSGSMPAQTANTTTNLTNNTFTQSGCIFNGWNTAANGTGTAYTNGAPYSFATDITLYAQWNCSSICPYLISAVINSCDGCASEGNNEFLLLNTGSYSFLINAANVNITYSNGPTNITSSFAAQPASLATLNTATINACGTTFVDVSAGSTIVPANSTLLIINKGACFTGDWSAYCGLGTVYVAFSASSAWTTTGFFGNNTTARTFVTNFSGVNSSCGSTSYAYNQTGIAGTPFGFSTDGASVLFNGSSPPTYINGNGTCAPPNTILPIELIDFYATQNGLKNDLVWKVASEKSVLAYIIEKSEDGINYNELANVKAKGIEDSYLSYLFEDNFPFAGINYYRLKTLENNGKINYYKIIDLDRTAKDWKPVIYQNGNELTLEFKNLVPKNSSVSLFDLAGKLLVKELIMESQTILNTQNLTEGMYFIKIQSPYKTENNKIIINKY